MIEPNDSRRLPQLVTCGCGHEIWSEDAEDLQSAIARHIRSSHPDLVGTLSPLELAQKDSPDNGVAARLNTRR